MPITNERIVWIDCEMTGLDTTNDALIEVAALVTDSELNILGDGVDVVIKPDDAALAQMNDFVRDMHTRSGLLEELPHGKTMAEAQAIVLDYIKKWVPEPRKAPLGGQLGGHRPRLPGPGHAGARGTPALPRHRREHHQGTLPPLVSRGPTSSPPPSSAATAPSATSRIPSTNCGTTARPSLSPHPDRTAPRRSRSPRRSWERRGSEPRPSSPGVICATFCGNFGRKRRKVAKAAPNSR